MELDIEMNEDYFNIAKDRINKEDLFTQNND